MKDSEKINQELKRLCAVISGKDDRIKKLEAALIVIANSRFCDYENTGGGQYGIGVTDGHRYCANIASAALDESHWNGSQP